MCPDCGAEVSETHASGCDVARCLHTGQQRLSCFKGHGPTRASTPGNIVWCAVLDAIRTDADRIPPADEVIVNGAAFCGCPVDGLHDDCGEDVWTGQRPGEAEAVEMGLWCRWGPPWIECSADHPEARPDLNRVSIVGRWDRQAARWVKR